MTLLDSFDRFMNAFIYRKKEETIVTEKDNVVFKADDYSEESKKWKADEKLTPKRRRELAITAPLFMKASKKKNLDCFRAWFEFENINTHKPPSVLDKKIIQLFDEKAQPRIKFLLAGICADIYGDGFILKKYSNDWLLKDGTIDITKPPKEGSKLSNLEMINPEFINEMEYLNNEYKKHGIQHYKYKNIRGSFERLIHPDRIIHIKDDYLPFSKLGISKVDMLRNIILSEADIDIAVGEILKWFSHGILNVTKIGMQPNEKKEILKVLSKHPNYLKQGLIKDGHTKKNN